MSERTFQGGGGTVVTKHVEHFFVNDQALVCADWWSEEMCRDAGWLEIRLRASLLTNGSEALAVWQRYASHVVAQWQKQNPGLRPRCWWRFDSPLKRLPETHPDQPGRIRTLEVAATEPANDASDVRPLFTWETQTQFLARHGLLTAGERKKLPTQISAAPNLKVIPNGE